MSNLPSLPKRGRVCPECDLSCVPLNCGPVIVDRCKQCGGIWFDDKEIRIFRDKLRELDLTELVPDENSPPTREGLFGCPRCRGIVMEPFHYGVNTGVKPLRCPRCAGIWLGGEELRVFLGMARRSQEMRPHVIGMTRALMDHEKAREKWKRMERWADPAYQPHFFLSILRWFIRWFR